LTFPKKVVIFGGKAAPGYFMAKLTIKLINKMFLLLVIIIYILIIYARAAIVNEDERIADRLKIVFIPNYNVSVAQIIIPAADSFSIILFSMYIFSFSAYFYSRI
jgi:starch phosphorylase